MSDRTAKLALEKFARDKDKVRRLEAQLKDARAVAGRSALSAQRAGVSRTLLAEAWGTNVNQLDVMLTRARSEERG